MKLTGMVRVEREIDVSPTDGRECTYSCPEIDCRENDSFDKVMYCELYKQLLFSIIDPYLEKSRILRCGGCVQDFGYGEESESKREIEVMGERCGFTCPELNLRGNPFCDLHKKLLFYRFVSAGEAIRYAGAFGIGKIYRCEDCLSEEYEDEGK